jgi:hypothetical protein
MLPKNTNRTQIEKKNTCLTLTLVLSSPFCKGTVKVTRKTIQELREAHIWEYFP